MVEGGYFFTIPADNRTVSEDVTSKPKSFPSVPFPPTQHALAKRGVLISKTIQTRSSKTVVISMQGEKGVTPIISLRFIDTSTGLKGGG